MTHGLNIIRTINEPSRYLRVFCGENARYDLAEPIVMKGWKYFTDGWVSVRIPTDELDSSWMDDGKGKRKIPRGFFKHPHVFDPIGEPRPLPVVEWDLASWEHAHQAECWECGNSHEEPGRVWTVRLHGVPFQRMLVEKVWRIPGVQLASAVSSEDATLFVFDGGGQVALMPLAEKEQE